MGQVRRGARRDLRVAAVGRGARAHDSILEGGIGSCEVG